MTLDEYWQAVNKAVREHPEWRYGQACSNVLYIYRPDLGNRIQGGPADPFYQDANKYYFAQWLADNWC